MFTKTAKEFSAKVASFSGIFKGVTPTMLAKAGLGLGIGSVAGDAMYQLQKQAPIGAANQANPPGQMLGRGPGYAMGYGQGPYAGMNPEGLHYDPAVVQRFLQMQEEQRSQGFGEA